MRFKLNKQKYAIMDEKGKIIETIRSIATAYNLLPHYKKIYGDGCKIVTMDK